MKHQLRASGLLSPRSQRNPHGLITIDASAESLPPLVYLPNLLTDEEASEAAGAEGSHRGNKEIKSAESLQAEATDSAKERERFLFFHLLQSAEEERREFYSSKYEGNPSLDDK